ncbi:hypothetical protein LguiA_026258 [Lonicera macranthoides]
MGTDFCCNLCFSYLPSNLEGAVRQSSEAVATFVSSIRRNKNHYANLDVPHVFIIVELFILQLQFLDDEGDKAELWELSRVYVNTLIEETTCEPSDRKPMEGEDEIIFMVVPDYQMFEYVEQIASSLLDDLVRT